MYQLSRNLTIQYTVPGGDCMSYYVRTICTMRICIGGRLYKLSRSLHIKPEAKEKSVWYCKCC